MKVTDKHVTMIDNVLIYLDNNKVKIVNELFGDVVDSYKDEWLARDPFKFWCHLDQGNRRELINMAQGYYGE